MAYIDDETSSSNARPIELYDFVGSFQTWRMTSHKKDVDLSGSFYTSTPLRRSKINVTTQDSSDGTLEIELPFDHEMVQRYAYEVSPPSLSVVIRRMHEGSFDTAIVWNGSVVGFQVEGAIAKLRSPSKFGYLLNNTIPFCRFQAPCNHVLYDTNCGVSKAAYQEVATVRSVQGSSIRLNRSFAVDSYVGGMMTSPLGESRMIVSNSGDIVNLKYPFSEIQAGRSVSLFLGCDHRLAGHCTTRFANTARFGGFPLVPDRNPFTSSLS